MDETYDEFSDILGAQVAMLPPSTSRNLQQQHDALDDAEDENLSSHGSVVSSDAEDVQETEVVQMDDDNVSNEDEGDAGAVEGEGATEAVAHTGGDPMDEDGGSAADDADGYIDADDIDDEVVDDDGDELQADHYIDDEVEEVQPDGDDDRVVTKDNEEEEPAVSNDVLQRPQRSSDGQGSAAPTPFALSRLKALFRHSCETSRATRAGPQVVLTTEAASVLAEATALMIKDLVNASAAETLRREKKTVAYDDVSFVVSQLDRYSFLSDILPHFAPPSRSNAPANAKNDEDRKASLSATAVKKNPVSKGKLPLKGKQKQQSVSAPSGGGRQLTLNFAPKPK